jgi:hypothetical protein
MVMYSRLGQPIGWKMGLRHAEQDGSYTGLDVVARHGAARFPEILWSVWKLNADATQGDYQAGTLAVKLNGWRLKPDTRIRQADGQLDVSQGAPPLSILTQGPAPDNYIPEGLMPLTYFLTARGKQARGFRMIFNDHLPPRGSNAPPTVAERVGPLANLTQLPRRVPGATVGAEIYLSAGGEMLRTRTYVFDQTGRTLALFYEKSTELLATDWATVHKSYPNANAHLAALVRLLSRRIATFGLPPHVLKGAATTPPVSSPAARPRVPAGAPT